MKQIQKNICFWYRFEKVFVAQNIQIVDHLWKLIINNIWIEYFQKNIYRQDNKRRKLDRFRSGHKKCYIANRKDEGDKIFSFR